MKATASRTMHMIDAALEGLVRESGASPEEIARVNARMKQIAGWYLERRGVW
jgi:hypothetical protein